MSASRSFSRPAFFLLAFAFREGFRDSLAFDETAVAAPSGDLVALKTAMIRLIEDGELRERLGRQGRERARAFGWDAIAGQEWKWITDIVKMYSLHA